MKKIFNIQHVQAFMSVVPICVIWPGPFGQTFTPQPKQTPLEVYDESERKSGLIDGNDVFKPYKSRFIANSSAYTATELSILLTSCLTAIKNRVIKYCPTVYERNGKNLIWSIKKSRGNS